MKRIFKIILVLALTVFLFRSSEYKDIYAMRITAKEKGTVVRVSKIEGMKINLPSA